MSVRNLFLAGIYLPLLLQSTSAQVIINEVYYDPEPVTSALEFIELHNQGTTSVDVGGWQFTKGIEYTLPYGTTISAGGFLVVAQDPTSIQINFGVTAVGPWIGRLSNDGETITLRDATGIVMDKLDYQRGFPWPVCPDGRSMELIHPSLDRSLGGSWRSSGVPANGEEIGYISASAMGWSYFKGLTEASSPVDAWRQLNFVEGADWLWG